MNLKYSLHGLQFEWDSLKATTNLRKHGVSFETAGEVFLDPFVYLGEEEVVDAEVRETAIGLTADWRLVAVIYVFRQDVIRLISARLATKAERMQYEEQ